MLGIVIGAVVIFLFFKQGGQDAGVARNPLPNRAGEQGMVEIPGEKGTPAVEDVEALPVSQEPVERITVTPGQGIGAVALQRYGGLNRHVYEGLKESNSGIQEWNRLDPGVELVLPEVALLEDSPSDFFTVQVLSLRSVERTRNAAGEFCRQGLQNVFVIEEKPDNRTGERWVGCCVGIFETVAESVPWKEKMRAQGFQDAFTVRLRGNRLKENLFLCPESPPGSTKLP